MIQILSFLFAATIAAYMLSALTMAIVAVFDLLLGQLSRDTDITHEDPEKLFKITTTAFGGGILISLLYIAVVAKSARNIMDIGSGVVPVFLGFQFFIILNLLVYSAKSPLRTAIAALLVFAGLRALLIYFGYWPDTPFAAFFPWQFFKIPGHGYLLNADIFFFAACFFLMIIKRRLDR